MPKENEKQRIFTRRAVIFGGLQLAAFAALAGRLFDLQFLREDQYATLSENNCIKLQLIAPERGLIVDRLGVPMATNWKNYRLFLDYSQLSRKAFHATLQKLQTLVQLPEKKLKSLENTRVSSASMPELLKDHLSWEEVSLVELHLLELPGVYVDSGQMRHYPFADQAAHLIGYVGSVSPEEMTDDQPLLRLPDFKIGKNGVEKMLDDELRGSAGIVQMEVNVHGVPVREISKKDSIPGATAHLTVDSRLQAYAAGRVQNQSAGLVVMEVDTGNVLALVSMPAFDPDIFSTGITTDYWKTLSEDKKNPLLDKAISGQYPPGSTFKTMVGLAGLQAGAITADTTIFCPGYFYLGNHQFRCWKQHGHGNIRFHEALQQSCDVFFYTVGNRLGIKPYAEMARQFGLGRTHHLGIDGEKPGCVPDPEWKLERFHQRWTGGDTINCAIGQGFVLATPLQLAVQAARIAGGTAVEPRLIVPRGQENPTFSPIPVSGDLLQTLRDAMYAVVNVPGGTAYSGRIMDARYAMAGKTGTAQVHHMAREGVNQASLPWEFRHHALFIGFAPFDAPKYACGVVIEHGSGEGEAAVPVARDVLLKAQQLAEADGKVTAGLQQGG